jgi:uncharacterized phage protein gp47/JayE
MALNIGLTTEGLVIPTVDEVVADINAEVWDAFGTTIDLSPNTPMGQYIGIFAERYVALCELAQAVYSSQDPDAATGDALEAIALLTGTTRAAATPSTATLTLTGTPATVVSAGSLADTDGNVEFATDDDATIATLTAWANTTAYVVGDRRRNASRAYVCITADITDGTVHWRYMGEGTGAIDVAATATATGPQAAISGTVVNIVTPVSGWSSVINLEDAEPGTSEDTDEQLRVRRVDELSLAGTSPVDAIRADLLDVPGVTAVTVFNNPTDDTDADGVTPHSVECLVTGGEDQDIWNALLAAVAGGIQAYGEEEGVAVDENGFEHTVAFTRPEVIDIYVAITVEVDARYFPLDGADQIEAAIVAWGDGREAGVNVRASAVSAQAFGIAGVLGVTVCNIDDAPAPATSTAIPLSTRQKADFDTSRITVTVSEVTP